MRTLYWILTFAAVAIIAYRLSGWDEVWGIVAIILAGLSRDVDHMITTVD